MIFASLILIPILFGIFSFVFLRGISFKEFLVQIGISVLISVMSAGVIYFNSFSFTEVWNGSVTKKTREKVSCRHSYSCHCYQSCSGSGKNRSCYDVCQTCYDHSYDIDWNIYSSIKTRINIDTVDRQGLKIPKLWDRTNVGEPYSVTKSYNNYIKASDGSLFKNTGSLEKYKKLLPEYPIRVYDYFKINRIVNVNVANLNLRLANELLSQWNASLGSKKQVNMILVFVNNVQRDYIYALDQHWHGANKNDAVLIIGLSDGKIEWAESIALINESIYKIKLRDSMQAMTDFDIENIINTFGEITDKYYSRKSMKEFEYLKASITPTTTEFLVALTINLIASLFMSYKFHNEEIF